MKTSKMKWEKCKLGAILRVTRGASLPGTGYADAGKYLRLTLGNFREEGGFKNFKTTQGKFFVGEFDSRFLMSAGDLITPLTEQSPGLLGSVAIIPCDNLYIQSQDVGLISCDAKKLDNGFAYYLFLTKSVREQISVRSQQTKIRHTSPDKIADVEVFLPPLPVQRRIAGVLGAMDEKIAVNRRKIAELEALAKTVYDYWFVQFDFPDAHGRPYRSSGGKMTWNASLKREIPDGWEVAGVSDCGNFCRGVSYSKHDELVKGTSGSISVLRGNNIAGGFVIKDSNEVFVSSALVSADQYLKKGDLLIAMSSGSKDHVGKCGLITHDLATCTFGAFCSVFRPREVYRFFVYDYLRGQAYRTYIQQICAGTGINNLKSDHFAMPQFALPCDLDLMEKFNKLQSAFFDQIMILDEECEALTLQRDTLLPLLMNGQVEVA